MNGKINITIDGNIVPLRFAYPAIRMFLEAMQNKSQFYYAEGIDGKPTMTVEGIAKFIECGYKNECLIKEIEPVFKYEFFYDFVSNMAADECIANQIADVFRCYGDTDIRKAVDESVGVDEKKN